jgi:5'-deoxynucleotidase YfbR-like HD superfamily hydrolase
MDTSNDIARVGTEASDPWMLTASGRKMYFLHPELDAINIRDIAVQLGNLCRFTGAVSQFHSVAQHSVMVARLVECILDDEGVDSETSEYWDQILAALLHDSEETYVNDLSSPLKVAIRGRYAWIADSIRRKVFEKHSVDYDYFNQTVKDADNIAILIERFYFMPQHDDWPGTPAAEMIYARPEYQDPHKATGEFMKAWSRAIRKRNALQDEGL